MAHDRIVFKDLRPTDINLKRIGDDLRFCVPEHSFELHVLQHYCRSEEISLIETNNHEIEEFRFVDSAEIWIADALYAEYQRDPQALITDFNNVVAETFNIAVPPPSSWKVKPFSQVLPENGLPATQWD